MPEKVPGTPLCLWNPIVDVDAVLRVFGKTRRLARATYVCELNIAEEEEWIGEKPGSLPWWRVGRPPKEEDDDPEDAIRKRRERERLGPEWRPAIPEDEFVQRGCGILGVDVEDIRSRSRGQDIVTGRALLMVLSVERYGLKVNATAVQIGQSSSGSSKELARGIKKRKLDGGFKKMLDDLDMPGTFPPFFPPFSPCPRRPRAQAGSGARRQHLEGVEAERVRAAAQHHL